MLFRSCRAPEDELANSREIGAREEALTGSSSRIEDLILRGSEKLSHQWKLLFDLWKGLERKGADWKAERDQRRRDISDQEQELTTQEAALSKEVKALDLRRHELERETERRLQEREKLHQKELDEKVKDVKYWRLKETEANQTIEGVKKELLAERESIRAHSGGRHGG